MKAKLIKVENTFYLKQGETILATSSIPNLSASIRYSLSKQNCDEIFGVVDVENLAFEHSNDLGGRCSNRAYKSFKSGFNKAMELNKDKVFTLEDINRAIRFGFDVGFCSNSDNKLKRLDLSEDEFIQSLQQPTEIDVEIVMETISDGLDEMAQPQYAKEPKLDSEGCLILKKI
jgi:hypothetical protein